MSYVGAFVIGLAFAFGWTPCVGPVLAAILFTAAGQEVGMSQPSVSRIISKLDVALGVQLFVRSTHAVRLTEAGEEYLTRIEPILADIEEANHFVRGTGETFQEHCRFPEYYLSRL